MVDGVRRRAARARRDPRAAERAHSHHCCASRGNTRAYSCSNLGTSNTHRRAPLAHPSTSISHTDTTAVRRFSDERGKRDARDSSH
jgi:hypothetical protein